MTEGCKGLGRSLLPRCNPGPPGGAIAPRTRARWLSATEISHFGLERPRKRRGSARRGRFRQPLGRGGRTWGRPPGAGRGRQTLGRRDCERPDRGGPRQRQEGLRGSKAGAGSGREAESGRTGTGLRGCTLRSSRPHS